MANVTIYDVAGAAKVSLATVSRVLNTPEKVNPDTRAKVLQVIKELGYRPNAIARGLASRKTTTVGIVVSDVTRASTSQLLGGICDIAKKYNYSVKLFSMAGESNIEDSIRIIISEQVDGVLFLNDELDASQMTMIKKHFDDSMTPVVLANVINENVNFPSVSIDYALSAYEMTKRLIDKNRKDIYLLTTVRKYSVNVEKEAGYVKAMKEHNLEPKILRTSGELSSSKAHFLEYFKENNVDAAIGVRDSIAVNFMNTMMNLGKEVPKDVMVIGFQNTKYAMLSRPALTCVDTPVYDIGAVAMRLLTKLMKQEPVDSIKVVLPHGIVSRESSE